MRRILTLSPLEFAGVFFLSLLAGYLLAAVEVLRLLPLGEIWRSLRSGPGVGWPAGAFVPLWLVCSLFAFLCSLLAARGPERVIARTALGRAALSLSPLFLLFPLVLDQEHALRRGPLYAVCLGATGLLGFFLGTSQDDVETSPEERGQADLALPWKAHLPVITVCVLHLVLFSFFSIRRDAALWSATVDLGIFKEALWNTLHGRVMHSPTVGYSFLGEHFSPVLFLLVPFYALFPSSATLLFAQTAAISSAGWPLYRLALSQGLGRPLATALAGSMLFAPSMHNSLMYDFHMDLLGVPALCWAHYFAWNARYVPMAVAAALLCSVKEEAFVSLTGLAAALFLSKQGKDRRPAVFLGIGALLYCGFVIAFVIKRFGPPPGVPIYMDSGAGTYKFLRNFSHFGGTDVPPGILRPLQFVLWTLSDARLTAATVLLSPVFYLSLLAGRKIFVLTPLVMLLLSDNPEISDLSYHYGAMQHPGVYVAAIFGAVTVLGWARTLGAENALQRGLCAGIILASSSMLWTHPRSVFAAHCVFDQRHVTERVRAIDRMIARVPADAVVSATSFGGPRFSNRGELFLFPQGLHRANWVYVDLQRPAWPANPAERDRMLQTLLEDERWGVVDFTAGAVVLSRGHSRERNAAALRALLVERSYEVEGTESTDFSGSIEADPEASDGYARVVRPTERRQRGFLVFGPFTRLPAGTYRVSFRLRAVPTTFGDRIGTVDVFSAGNVLGQHVLSPEDFPDLGWKDVSIDFRVHGHEVLEFRVFVDKQWTLGADRISVRPTEN